LAYAPEKYSAEVVVYEASVTPLLYLPQLGRIWRNLAPQAQIVSIIGTHIGMMHEPYVAALAQDISARAVKFYSPSAR
jgi:thioesterase domain-containing protein